MLKLTQMRKYNSGKFWAVVLVADAKHRPFMLSQVLPPQLYITDVDVNSTTQALRSVARQGWKSVHGFGYLWPQLAVGCVESGPAGRCRGPSHSHPEPLRPYP